MNGEEEPLVEIHSLAFSLDDAETEGEALWSERTGVPADLSDGDAESDTLLGLPCADGFVAEGRIEPMKARWEIMAQA